MSRKKKLFGFGTVFLILLTLAPLASAQGTVVQVTQNAALGEILTDSQGMTLYMFTKDEPNLTNCYDGCATAWPPLLVPGGEEPMAGAGITGQLGVIERTDGGRQVTYNDMPLYYFTNDSIPDDTNGQGVNDVWFVVHPDAPSVTVSDQGGNNGSVTIARVVVAEPSWLVVHAEADGRPGPVIGHSALNPGENTDVVVQIDAAQATPTLFAMLHVDRGTIGTYEFPGDDGPVTLAGQVVTPPFQVTGELPATLPAAGASPTPWLLIFLAVGALALFTGFGLSLARRSR